MLWTSMHLDTHTVLIRLVIGRRPGGVDGRGFRSRCRYFTEREITSGGFKNDKTS